MMAILEYLFVALIVLPLLAGGTTVLLFGVAGAIVETAVWAVVLLTNALEWALRKAKS